MRYKIIDTTDNKREGAYIDLPDEALHVGTKIPLAEMVFQIDRVKRSGDILVLHSSNCSVILRAVSNG